MNLHEWQTLLDSLLAPAYSKGFPPCDGIRATLRRVSPALIEFCRQTGELRVHRHGRYQLFGRLLAPDGTPVAVIAAQPSNPFAREWIWINPSKGGLSVGQVLALIALAGGSTQVLKEAVVRDVHIKLDIPGVTVQELAEHLHILYQRSLRLFKGTVYVNSRRGTHYAVYDLGARRGEEPGRVTRLEIRVRYKTDNKRNQERFTPWDWADLRIDLDKYFERVTIGPPGEAWPNLPDLFDERLVAWHGELDEYLFWLDHVDGFLQAEGGGESPL